MEPPGFPLASPAPLLCSRHSSPRSHRGSPALHPRHPPSPGFKGKNITVSDQVRSRVSPCVRACVVWSGERRRNGGVFFGDGRGCAERLEDAGEDRPVCGCVPVERGGALRPATSQHPPELPMRCPVSPSLLCLPPHPPDFPSPPCVCVVCARFSVHA